jgi:hypothetical protein
VPLKAGTSDIPVFLDSGADRIYLFENRVSSWLRVEPDEWHRRVRLLSSERLGSRITLSRDMLGTESFAKMSAVVLESAASEKPHTLDWHGLMGIECLNAKRVRIDFSNGVFSWER